MSESRDSQVNRDTNVLDFECSRARRAVHDLLDAEALDVSAQASLDEHLAGCEACRSFRADLETMQEAMRTMPALRFPDAALREVRARVEHEPASPVPPVKNAERWRPDWRSFAAAAILTAAAFGLWEVWDSRRGAVEPAEPRSTLMTLEIDAERLQNDPEYARQVAEDTRRVLALTSIALRKTERAAIRGILADKVSTSLDRVPIHWPDAEVESIEDAAQKRRRENEI